MQDILFLEPVFHEKIWGGEKLKTHYNYQIPSNKTGECWAISAHKNGDCLIANGEHKGKKLSQLWANNRELFGNMVGDQFPLLTKILDASDDLSVQVHPDDEYGLRVEKELGKTECWYIIDCEENAEIVYGHNANTKAEFNQMIDDGEWNSLLKRVKVKPGDFYYVPAGTVHAICEGILILETQQSSDTTYRVYDYDRRDNNNNLRELHIDKSKEVTTIPHVDSDNDPKVTHQKGLDITTYVSNEFFTVEKWHVNGNAVTSKEAPFVLISVLDGEGSINNNNIKKGTHFIVTSAVKEMNFEGNMELMISFI